MNGITINFRNKRFVKTVTSQQKFKDTMLMFQFQPTFSFLYKVSCS